MSSAKAIIKRQDYNRRPDPVPMARKQRSGRRTKATSNHRCWWCDNHIQWEAEVAANPDSYSRRLLEYGCSYQRRLAKAQA